MLHAKAENRDATRDTQSDLLPVLLHIVVPTDEQLLLSRTSKTNSDDSAHYWRNNDIFSVIKNRLALQCRFY